MSNNFNDLCTMFSEDATMTARDMFWEYIQRREQKAPSEVSLEQLYQLLIDFRKEMYDYLSHGKNYGHLRASEGAGREVGDGERKADLCPVRQPYP